MMKRILFGLSFIFLFACSHSPKTESSQPDLSKVKIGMNYTEVLSVAGFPDTIIHLGITTDQFYTQTKTDEWFYGDNQVLVLVNDTVNAIDLDARATEARIRRIIDSAKAADSNPTQMIEPLGQ